MVADEAYVFLNRAGYVDGHAFFSTAYLGRGPRYYDHLRCSNVNPSVHVLIYLAGALADIGRAELSPTRAVEAMAIARNCLAIAMHRCKIMRLRRI